MTKKDYRLIALILAGLCPACKPAAIRLAVDLLKEDNSAFSEDKFRKAIEGH